MEKAQGFSPDRNVLCLFDVDGTLTPPREVSSLPIDNLIIIVISYDQISWQLSPLLPSSLTSDERYLTVENMVSWWLHVLFLTVFTFLLHSLLLLYTYPGTGLRGCTWVYIFSVILMVLHGDLCNWPITGLWCNSCISEKKKSVGRHYAL